MMDPFEEFEFKPITEGLGFHNKKPQSKIKSSSLDDLEFMAPDLSTLEIQKPLPRKHEKSELPPIPSTSKTVDDILQTLNNKKHLDYLETPKIQSAPLEKGLYSFSSFDLSAALLDGMMIVASFLASLIVLLVITKVDLFSNLINPDDDGFIWMGLVGLFSFLSWSYLIINRIFIGQTPGEWVFDQRIGAVEQFGSASYSLRVVLRSTLAILTGFILFPLLSLIFKKDFLGQITGVRLMKKV